MDNTNFTNQVTKQNVKTIEQNQRMISDSNEEMIVESSQSVQVSKVKSELQENEQERNLPQDDSHKSNSLILQDDNNTDELTVDFDMGLKIPEFGQRQTTATDSTNREYQSWFGLKADITGSVTSDSTHKRHTDSTATYKVYAHANQQPPTEGMAQLTSLFAQTIEPISAVDYDSKKPSK